MAIRIICTVTTDLTYDQRMQRICSSLANAGYVVTLVGRKLSTSQPLNPTNYKQKRIRCLINKGKLFYLEYNFRLFFYLLFHRVDIINSIDLDTILSGFTCAKIRRKQLVYDAHEYFTEVIELMDRPKTQRFWLRIEKTIIPKLEHCYTVNKSLSDLYKDKYGVSFEVIRNAPLLTGDKPLTSNKLPPYLIYIGAVNAGRGIEETIRAMSQINCNLIICGNGDIYDEMIQLTEELNLSDKIEFKGYVVPEELKKLTINAYAGLLLLENKGKSYFYSLANKFFDYVHAEIPQLVIEFPEYSRIMNQFKVGLFTELKVDSITRNAQELLANPDLYNHLKMNTQSAKTKFNWQNEEKALIDFYANIYKP